MFARETLNRNIWLPPPPPSCKGRSEEEHHSRSFLDLNIVLAGYTVDANLNSVTLSSTSPASPSTATQGSSSSGGSSTNVGAIVGGVVGGVAAVALAAILALWLFGKKRRHSKVSTPFPLSHPQFCQ